MKRLIGLAFAALFVFTANAQEGHLKYTIDIQGDDPQVEMMKSFFTDATMEIFYSEDFSRVDTKMGSMMNTTMITDLKKEETLTLMSGMMGKIATRSTLDELSAEEGEEEAEEEVDLDIELIDESKEIAGLNCKKAFLTTEEGQELEMWYTEDIQISDKRGLNMANQKGIPGFPVEFSMQQGPMIMAFSLTEYNKKIKGKDLFDMTIPEGYVEKSAEELKQMGQGR